MHGNDMTSAGRRKGASAAVQECILANPYFKESRLGSLYSDFSRLQQLNPDGYEANINAWMHLLVDLLDNGALCGSSSVSVSTASPNLLQVLSLPKHGPPHGLSTVLAELTKRKQLVPFSRFAAFQEPFTAAIRDKSSFLDYVSPSKWLLWGLSTIGLTSVEFNPTLSNGDLKPEHYIVWDYLVKRAETIYNKLLPITVQSGILSNLVYDHHSLLKVIQSKIDPTITPFDLDVLLIYFARDTHRIVKKHVTDDRKESNTYVKFIKSPRDTEITDEDIGIINLKSSIYQLTNRNETLRNKVEVDISQQLSKLVNKNNHAGDVDVATKSRIKKLLINRKTIQKSLDKSMDVLDQLNTILLKIDDANLNTQIYHTYKSSSQILSNLNSKVSLSDIDNIKVELDEEIDRADEISEALYGSSHDIDADEIDQELDRLYASETATKSQQPVAAKPDAGRLANSGSSSTDLLNKLDQLNIDNKSPVGQNDDVAEAKPKEATLA